MLNPMKLFAIIFSAILAAAAVIWAVASNVQKSKAEAAEDKAYLDKAQTEARQMASAMSAAPSSVPDYLLKNAPTTAKLFLWHAQRQGRAASHHAKYFVEYWREIVQAAPSDYPGRKEWANDIETTLRQIEAAVK